MKQLHSPGLHESVVVMGTDDITAIKQSGKGPAQGGPGVAERTRRWAGEEREREMEGGGEGAHVAESSKSGNGAMMGAGGACSEKEVTGDVDHGSAAASSRRGGDIISKALHVPAGEPVVGWE